MLHYVQSEMLKNFYSFLDIYGRKSIFSSLPAYNVLTFKNCSFKRIDQLKIFIDFPNLALLKHPSVS